MPLDRENPNVHAIIHKLLAALRIVEQRTEFAGTRNRSVIHSIKKKEKVLFHFLISVDMFHVEHVRSSLLATSIEFRVRLILGGAMGRRRASYDINI